MAGRRAVKDETRIALHHSREGSHEVTVARVVETTECARLSAIADDSQKIGDFLDWLRERGITLCRFHDRREEYYPEGTPFARLLAEYFEIDEDKVAQERRALLAALREAQS